MSKLNVKLLTFYSVSIAVVGVLFKVVTVCGETNLKAPPAIAGNYRFDRKSLPECLKSDVLVLTIEQSGVYLSGKLRAGSSETDIKTTAEDKLSLSGKWENQGLSLSGKVENLAGCSGEQTAGGKSFVKLRGIVEGNSLNGKISLTDDAGATIFFAKRETAVKQENKTH
ncbi:MAG: hypothetical protein MUE44_31040 [Oscillatoriaceae cyanobacterium Prado104]|jgi:hypothetical protein|nr:hypothetical protein [Oscillatoriaceae cyanobacterium Prado104]